MFIINKLITKFSSKVKENKLVKSSKFFFVYKYFIPRDFRLNYKPVFWFGATVGILSGLICTVAVFLADGTLTLVLLAIGSVPQGISYGIINYYRHLASCIGQADENSRSWQIAIVVTGGVFAGIVGPWVSTLAVHMIPGHEYVGSYVFITVANLLHFALLMFVKLDRLPLGKLNLFFAIIIQFWKNPLFSLFYIFNNRLYIKIIIEFKGERDESGKIVRV